MSKKGRRLREFEKNNRTFNVSEASEKRAEKYSSIAAKREKRSSSAIETDEKSKEQKRKKKLKIVNMKRFVASVIIVLLIASVGVSVVNIVKLTLQRNELQAKNADLIKLKEDLTAETEYINSAEYMEQQARKELKMIKENELLFIISDDNDKDK